jgi:flagellar hook-length control protein FliK
MPPRPDSSGPKRDFAKELNRASAASKPTDAAAEQAAAKEASPATSKRDEFLERTKRRSQLKPLQDAARQNKEAMRSLPVMAFLTGQMERINPASIPELVTGNAFINEAFAEGDIAEFLNKDMDVDEILEALTIPNSLVQEAVANGLDLKQVVSPADLLRTLGFDPSRIQAELTTLRDKMEHGGLASYMTKAAALRGVAPGQVITQAAPTGPTVPVDTPNLTGMGLMNPTTKMPVGLSSAPPLVQQQALTQHPANQNGAMPPNQMAMAQNNQMQTSQMVHPLYEGTPSPAVSPMGFNAQGIDGFGEMNAQSNLTAPASLDLSGVNPQGQGPTMKMAEKDPFNSMDLEGIELERVAGGRVEAKPQGPVTDELLSRQFKVAMPAAMAQQNPANKVENLESPINMAVAQEAVELPLDQQQKFFDARVSRSNKFENVPHLATMAKPEMGNLNTNSTTQPMSKAVAVEDLQLDVSRFSRESDSGDEQNESQDQGQNSDGFGQNQFANIREAVGDSGGRFAQTMGVQKGQVVDQVAPETLSTAERAQVVQNLMDQASAMVKKGGGAMKLDLNHAGLGQLELAVNMQDERVDLKILTASDRVRELISGELASLRNALVVQNIELGNVDVGVDGREQSMSFLNQEQNQQQKAQQEMQEFFSELANSGDTNLAGLDIPNINAFKQAANLRSQVGTYRNDGRIEVRV